MSVGRFVIVDGLVLDRAKLDVGLQIVGAGVAEVDVNCRAWCKNNCRVPWPSPPMIDNTLPERIDAQRRRQHGPPTISTARSFPWVEIRSRLENKFRRQARPIPPPRRLPAFADR